MAVTPAVNGSLLLGYSNELYPREALHTEPQDGELRAALRFNWRPADQTSVNAGYDTLGNQATVSAYQSNGSGIGRWDTSVDVEHRGYEDAAGVSASAGYTGNRADVRLSHYADTDDLSSKTFSRNSVRQRTSLRAGTAIAFAADKVAVGTPVRGGAFAIVTPHSSLADKEIAVGSADNIVAKSDAFGNALVPDVPVYSPSSISVDVADLPLGYSLGSGAFDTFAPYKAGYAFEVGSEYAVTVYGTLLLADGQPVSLLTGMAHPEVRPDKHVAVFTNAEGKFGADGLAPGRWILEMATEGAATRFVLDVPEATTGLIKIGTLRPSEDSP